MCVCLCVCVCLERAAYTKHSPLSSSAVFLSSHKETPYPWRTHSPFPLSPVPGNPVSRFWCVCVISMSDTYAVDSVDQSKWVWWVSIVLGINPKTVPTFVVRRDAVTGQSRRTPGVLTSVLMWWENICNEESSGFCFSENDLPKIAISKVRLTVLS